jgi:hypothetical protein
MLLFLGAWIVIAVRVLVARSDDMDARARLALEGDGDRGIVAPVPHGRRIE